MPVEGMGNIYNIPAVSKKEDSDISKKKKKKDSNKEKRKDWEEKKKKDGIIDIRI